MDDQQALAISRIQESPGGLVWVRRRNGSWWPGRIVRPEDLPSKCKPRRAGTPIKLLGKEDGSMDWYNLKKSTRVKPFRCGEYDDYIEKVEASSVSCSRKTTVNVGKYVRREDAILHALNLERACLGISKSFHATSKQESRNGQGSLLKQPGCSSGSLSAQNNLAQELSQSAITFEQPFKLVASDAELLPKKKWRTPNDSEDGEGTKRMRDLQEIGVNGTSNRKLLMDIHPKRFDDHALVDCASPSGSRVANGSSGVNHATSSKDSCLSMKRKRTNVTQARETARRKDRRRLLTKVCEGTKIIVPSYCHWDGSFAQQPVQVSRDRMKASISSSRGTDFSAVTSNSSECSEASSEETFLDAREGTCEDGTDFDSEVKESELSSMLEFIENDCSNSLVDIPLVVDETIYADSSSYQHYATEEQNGCDPDVVVHYGEGVSESNFSGCAVQINHVSVSPRQQKCSVGLQQHPDKMRSMSHLTSRSDNSGTFRNVIVEQKTNNKQGNERTLCHVDIKQGTKISDDSLASDYHGQMVKNEPIASSCVPRSRESQTTMLSNQEEGGQPKVALKFQSAFSNTRQQERLLGRDVPTKLALVPCSRYQAFQQPRERGAVSLLYDVEVSVQSSYQGPHVPLVSFMSRLDGKAIVGHPVSVEVLASGACDALVTRHQQQREKRKISLSLRKGGKSSRSTCKKVANARKHLKTGNFTNKSKRLVIKQNISNKKKGFSPRKIRRLSSISVDLKGKEEDRKPLVEKIVGPAVTCIPLRLVFSRITEALTCPVRSACGS